MAPLDLTPKQQMTAIIWYMQGCIATFYDNKKKPVGTESLLLAANLAYRKINLLVRSSRQPRGISPVASR